MDISVVIPVYNEEDALPAFYRALAEALDQLPQSAEIIFADDGSTDGSAAGSTRSPRPTRGSACCICRATTARPRRMMAGIQN